MFVFAAGQGVKTQPVQRCGTNVEKPEVGQVCAQVVEVEATMQSVLRAPVLAVLGWAGVIDDQQSAARFQDSARFQQA
jgi:hypothetical protein